LLEAYGRRHAEATPAAYEQIELTYHDITDAKVFEGLMARGTMPRRVSQRRIEMAVHEPPAGTRAMVRGEFVRAASSSSAEWSCDWTHIEARNDVHRYEARLLDPFETQMDASVREVFDALRQL
jgi:proteasome accessory factor A